MLIQALVGIVIASVAMAAMVSLSTQQSLESKALSEKLASIEMRRQLMAAASDSDTCSTMLANQIGATPIDLSNPAVAQVAIQTLSPTGARAPLAAVGQATSNISNSLTVQSISLKNFVFTGTPDKYIANLVIDYDAAKLTRPLLPSSAKVVVLTSGAPGAKLITGCTRKAGAAGVRWTLPLQRSNCSWVRSCNFNVSCPAGQYVSGLYTGLQSISRWGAWVCSNIYCCTP